MKLTFIFVCLSFILQAQSVDFINVYFNNKTIGDINIEIDGEGNLFVVGTFTGTMDLNPGVEEDLFTANVKSFFVSKYNPQGEVDWIKVIGDDCNAKDIEIDKNGDLLVVGQFKGEINFEPGTTDYILDSGSNSIFGYVYKLDADGNTLGVNRFQCVFGVAEATIVRTDEENNVIIAGTYNEELNVDLQPFSFSILQSPLGSDAFIVKYDANLFLKWKESLGWTSGGAWIEDIHIDGQGDVYVLGHFTGVLDFDEDEQISTNGGHDIFLAKHPKNGNMWNWYKTYGGSGNDVANKLMFNEEENTLWICGHFDEDIQFDINGVTTIYSADQQEGLLIEANTVGEIEKLIPFEGNKGQFVSLSKSNSENIWVYGNFSDSLKLGNTLLKTDSLSALFIGRMNQEGTFLSGIKIAESTNFQLGNQFNNFREYQSFLAMEDDVFFISGDFPRSSLLTIEDPNENISTEDNCSNGFVLKTNALFTTSTDRIEPLAEKKISIFPNPSVNRILNIKGNENLSQIQVFNIQGDLIFQKDFPEKSLALNNLKSGTYIIKMISANSILYRIWVVSN